MKILICTDASEQAGRALRLGAAIAAGCRAEVTFLGIVESRGESKPILDSLKQGQALLKQHKIDAEWIKKSGNPVEEIIAHTRDAHYDLVVIGAVRKESRGPFWMSSKSYNIIKEITPPVLSVAGNVTTLKRVLICTGGMRYNDNAIRLTGQIARGMNAGVTLLHVMPQPPALYARLSRVEETADWLLNSQTELGMNLHRARESLKSLGVSAELRLRQGSVLQGILHEIHQGHYDLVVTGSALSGSLRAYALGDITREIVNRANRAVLVVRTHETSADARFSLRGFLGLARR